MTINERTFTTDIKLSRLCSEQGYCTECTSNEYIALLNKYNHKELTSTNDIEQLAHEILQLSNIDNMKNNTGFTYVQLLCSVMYQIRNFACITSYTI